MLSHFPTPRPTGLCLAPRCRSVLVGRRSHALTCSPRCRQRFSRALRRAKADPSTTWAAARALAWGLEERDFWRTPAAVYAALSAEYGPFDLDAAATAEDALAPLYLTPEDDALSVSWVARCQRPALRRRDLAAASDHALYQFARREGWDAPCAWQLALDGYDASKGLGPQEREAAIGYLVALPPRAIPRPRIWNNPPYSRKGGKGDGLLAWVRAAVRARDEGGLVVQLVQAAHATEWAKLAKAEAAERLEADRRIHYVDPANPAAKGSNRHESVIFVYLPGERGPARTRDFAVAA